MTEPVPTWIYHPTEAAKVIDLAPGDALPDGWFNTPACVPTKVVTSAPKVVTSAAKRTRRK